MAFIGANGITLEEGITTPNFVEAMTKKSMVSSATRVYAVLDASKFQQVSLAVIAPLKEITAVITAGDLEEELAALYESQGIEIRR
jgi:DeoR family fructose operon transcriptional repressor